jgi:acetolactate synthase I/II/III large subunit
LNGSDLLVEMLKARGVTFVATVSGNGLNPFFVSCARRGIRVVDFRNEQAASYAADAYARLTGKVGVCAVSSGVAHVNAFSGLINAFFDGAPVFLFTGASAQSHTDVGRFQDMDQVAMAAPLCKYAREVHQAERIPFYVHEAFSHAVAGRPGPVHLTIPLDVLDAEVGEVPGRLLKAARRRWRRAARPTPP